MRSEPTLLRMETILYIISFGSIFYSYDSSSSPQVKAAVGAEYAIYL